MGIWKWDTPTTLLGGIDGNTASSLRGEGQPSKFVLKQPMCTKKLNRSSFPWVWKLDLWLSRF